MLVAIQQKVLSATAGSGDMVRMTGSIGKMVASLQVGYYIPNAVLILWGTSLSFRWIARHRELVSHLAQS